MKEAIIFILILLFVVGVAMVIFNGRFIYAQIKYSFIGSSQNLEVFSQNPEIFSLKEIKNVFYSNSNEEEKDVFLPDRLYIPQIPIEAPVVISQNLIEANLQKDLEKGVIYLPGSSALNETGTMVIMGHSSAYPWYKGHYGSIFALLNKLNINDEIVVFSKENKFIYRVVAKEIKAPKDLIFQKDTNDSVLYLVSCWPVNTAWKRIVIKTIQVLNKMRYIGNTPKVSKLK